MYDVGVGRSVKNCANTLRLPIVRTGAGCRLLLSRVLDDPSLAADPGMSIRPSSGLALVQPRGCGGSSSSSSLRSVRARHSHHPLRTHAVRTRAPVRGGSLRDYMMDYSLLGGPPRCAYGESFTRQTAAVNGTVQPQQAEEVRRSCRKPGLSMTECPVGRLCTLSEQKFCACAHHLLAKMTQTALHCSSVRCFEHMDGVHE